MGCSSTLYTSVATAGTNGGGVFSFELEEGRILDRIRPWLACRWGTTLNKISPCLALSSRHAPVAQLDSASVFGTEGCRFESCRAYFVPPVRIQLGIGGFFCLVWDPNGLPIFLCLRKYDMS